MAATQAQRQVQNDEPGRLARWREALRRGVRRSGTLLAGAALCALSVFAALALISYRPSDPALNTVAGGPVRNWMGNAGAWTSDLLLMLMGLPAALLLPLLLIVGLRLARGAEPGRWLRSLLLSLSGIILLGLAAALLVGGAVSGLPAGWGGAIGLGLAGLIETGLAAMGEPGIVQPFRIAIIALAAAGGLALWLYGL